VVKEIFLAVNMQHLKGIDFRYEILVNENCIKMNKKYFISKCP